jgi:hypothetical protein
MIGYLFRLLQRCLVTYGGGALIWSPPSALDDSPQEPSYLLGA